MDAIYLSIYLSNHLTIYLTIYLSVCLSFYLDLGASSLNSRSGSGRSGSGSEIYEKLADSGDMLSHSDDDSDVYSQLDSVDSHNISR